MTYESAASVPHRILFLINSLSMGGAEGVFIAQANELHRRGWDVHVVTVFFPGPFASRLEIPQNRQYCLNASSVFDLRAISKLIRYVRSEKIDILYSTLNESNTIGRIVRIFHTDITVYTREMNMADIKPFIYKTADIFLGFLSHTIVAVSRAVADSVRAYAPWLRKRMYVLYNGVSVADTLISRPPSSQVRLLTVGSLTPKKAHVVLIDAMAELPTHFTLSIAGEGALRMVLEQRVRELGLAERVTFLGIVEPIDMNDLYRAHDAFVLPSEREGCPNVVSEAQSLCMPVIAFDIPGMNEFVSDTNGTLVRERTPRALAEAIQSTCVTAEHMRALGTDGYRKVLDTRERMQQFEKLISLFTRAE